MAKSGVGAQDPAIPVRVDDTDRRLFKGMVRERLSTLEDRVCFNALG